jgi:hypothetical protein
MEIDHYDSDVFEENYQYKIKTSNLPQEINPLTANRLFSLGLEGWIFYAQILTTWKFKIDDVNISRDGEVHPFRPFRVPSPQSNGDVYSTGQDLSVLVACNTKFQMDFEKINSGKFPIDKPSIFFNQIPVVPLEVNSIDTWLLHRNTWSATGRGSSTNLISNPGKIYGQIVNVLFPLNKCEKNITGADFSLHGPTDIPTSLDSRKGSSGGLSLIRGTNNGVLNEYFYGWGINSFAKTSREICASLDPDWCRTEQVPPSDAMFKSNNDAYDHYALMAAFSIENAKWTKREIRRDDGNPFELVVWKPNSTVNVPNCNGDDCLSFYKIQKNGLISDISNSEIKIDSYYDWDENFNVNEYSSNISNNIEYPNPHKYRFSTCNNIFSLSKEPGIALGFIGNSTNPSAQGMIENLHVVCGPWSSAPYVDNWSFIFHIGRSFNGNSDTILGAKIPYVGRLRYSVMRFSELREYVGSLIHTHLRPISLKMCPPNYALNGIVFVYEDFKISGIESLICVKTNPDVETSIFLVKSMKNNDDIHFMNGDPFDISQRIGKNTAENPNSKKEIRCNGTDVVGGIVFPDDELDRIYQVSSLEIACINNPGGLN